MIVVCTPVNTDKLYCWDEYCSAVKKLGVGVVICDTSPNKEMRDKILKEGFTYMHCYSEKAMDRVVNARQDLVDWVLRALEGPHAALLNPRVYLTTSPNIDAVMFVDGDIIVQPDIINRLLAHDKDIVSGVYFTVGKDEVPRVVHNIETDKEYKPLPVEMLNGELIEAVQIGFGCVLIKTDVLKKMRFRCERNPDGSVKTGEDYYFCNDWILKHDGKIFVDTSIQVPHKMGKAWDMTKA